MNPLSSIQKPPEYFIQPSPKQESPFRTVFGSKHLQGEFVKFLKTIFFQLDEKKVLEEMDKILSDPSKSDPQIYKELVQNIDQMRNRFPALFYKLKALSVLDKGMGLQAAQLMKGFRKEEFHNYLEVYFRRHLKTIQKTAGLPLNGKIFSLSDTPHNGSIKEKIEARSLFSSNRYQLHVPLNDPDCENPEMEPEKTHKPIGNEVKDGELDLIACLGGLHHIPKDRAGAFVESMAKKLKPGGVVLLRDHNAATPEIRAITSVVHSFVNAENKVPWDVESKEIREFQSADHWTQFMESHHFTKISKENLVLPEDPTENGMMVFVKNPANLDELRVASKALKSCVRPIDGTKATWIEWGNVRFSKQYAEFIQTKHPYAFDYIGHLKQHWNFFTNYIKESRKDLSLKEIIFSDNFAMNVFILLSTVFQCISGYVNSIPSMLVARLKHGAEWRETTDLTALEKYEAGVEKEYSEFIDHTPFYMFPYFQKIKGLWSAILNSNESRWTKITSAIGAASSTIGLSLKAAVSAPIRSLYSENGQFVEPDTVSILIHDPADQFQTGQKLINGKMENIKVVFQTPDHHKLVLVPRYRVFTELCHELANNENVKLLEIGSQSKITLDVLYEKMDRSIPSSRAAKALYEMPKLQDLKERRYGTYEVDVEHLQQFQRSIKNIEYIHE